MRHLTMIAAVTLLVAGLAGCSDSAEDRPLSTEPEAAPRIDRDPTPQTGTGGEQVPTNPDDTPRDDTTQNLRQHRVSGRPRGRAGRLWRPLPPAD